MDLVIVPMIWLASPRSSRASRSLHYAGNPQRLVEYYSKLFGDPGMSEGGYTGWQIGSGFVTVGPHDAVHGSNAQPGRIIWNIETPDVKGEFDRLVAAGARVVREPYSFEAPLDGWIATLADPDDNYFQLMSPMGPQPGRLTT